MISVYNHLHLYFYNQEIRLFF